MSFRGILSANRNQHCLHKGNSMNPIETILQSQKVFIVDGAFGTELERKGHDINDRLWSAKFLLHKPEAITEVHLDYLKAGADCITTASYQATFEGFMQRGLSEEESKKLIQSSVSIAQDARDAFWEDETHRHRRQKPLVAASVGPYGAYLADGSEFRGDYALGFDELVAFHEKRLLALLEMKPDIIACETIPCLVEAKALCYLLRKYATIPAWMSFSAKDGHHINSGETIGECAQFLESYDGIIAIGINCTAPQFIPELIAEMKKVSTKHILVYPNGGATYNALTKTWSGLNQNASYGLMAYKWYEQGARLIGGCCQTTPEDIAQIASFAR